MSALRSDTPRRATEANKPGTPRRARDKLYKHRAGNAGMFGEPAVTNSCAFYPCTRGCGCAKHPAFPAPSILRGTPFFAKPGQIVPRQRLFASSAVMPRFRRGIQYSRGLSDELSRLWNTGSPGRARTTPLFEI